MGTIKGGVVWEWTTSSAHSWFLFPNLFLLSTPPAWWGGGGAPSSTYIPSALSQISGGQSSHPPKVYCQCSPYMWRGQMNTKLIWGREPASTQALQSIGVGGRGATGDSEMDELVWAVKVALRRKWSGSRGDHQLEWGQECLWIFKAEGIGHAKGKRHKRVWYVRKEESNSGCLGFGLNGRGKKVGMGRWDGSLFITR